MYKMIVGEISKPRREKWDLKSDNPYSVWDGKAYAAEICRISALSSADYCLHSRLDVDWGSVAWKGSAEQIRRVFRAERLNDSGLAALEEGKDYAVLFLELALPVCA